MSADSSMAETLRADRSRDWQDLIGTWSEKLLQGPETATVFDLNGEPVPTDKAMMCSQREAEWADFKTPPGEILVHRPHGHDLAVEQSWPVRSSIAPSIVPSPTRQ